MRLKLSWYKAIYGETWKDEAMHYIWNRYARKLRLYISHNFRLDKKSEDLVQDVMIKIYTGLESYNTNYSFNMFIYTTCRNRCIDFLRTQKIEEEYSEAFYIDMPSISITLIISLLITLAFYTPREIRSAFRAAKERHKSPPVEIKQGIVFFTALQKLIVAASILGFLIGAVIMLVNVPDAGPPISMSKKWFKRDYKHFHYDYQKKLLRKAYKFEKRKFILRRDLSSRNSITLKNMYPFERYIKDWCRGWAASILTFFYAAFFLLILTLPFKYALLKKLKALE